MRMRELPIAAVETYSLQFSCRPIHPYFYFTSVNWIKWGALKVTEFSIILRSFLSKT